jgi:tRNA pseudouridine55 synthase
MPTASIHGLLVLDKSGGMTSRDAVDRAQCWFPRGTRIGHTGTLDPLATGVLVHCIGNATRLTEYVQRMGKTYRTRLLLGATSDTDDADGTVTPQDVLAPPDAAAVAEALQGFLGQIEQVPPAYSAAKVTGRRAYDLARRGQEVVLQARTVRIDALDILAFAYPRLDLEVRCGKGTYIRSLARDLGQRLGCGALVETLRRTRVGPFRAEDAVSLEADAATARASLRPVAEAVAELPRLDLDAAAVARLRQGQGVALSGALRVENLPAAADEAAVFDPAGRLAAVAGIDRRHACLLPLKVLAG